MYSLQINHKLDNNLTNKVEVMHFTCTYFIRCILKQVYACMQKMSTLNTTHLEVSRIYSTRKVVVCLVIELPKTS